MNFAWESDGVRKESTGWRDQFISEWHRKIGYNAPAMDIDGISILGGEHEGAWIEYDRREPVALFEYKTIGHLEQRGLEKLIEEVKPLTSLANRADLPAYLVVYDSRKARFLPYCLTHLGVDYVGDIWLSERDYAAFLYQIRNRTIPVDLYARLSAQV